MLTLAVFVQPSDKSLPAVFHCLCGEATLRYFIRQQSCTVHITALVQCM
jgi:hypothetical protein